MKRKKVFILTVVVAWSKLNVYSLSLHFTHIVRSVEQQATSVSEVVSRMIEADKDEDDDEDEDDKDDPNEEGDENEDICFKVQIYFLILFF